MDYSEEIKQLIIDASKLTGLPIKDDDFYIEHQPLKHKPKALPNEKMAVYTFVYNGVFLKIGQANANSKARYQSHPYHPDSANSTLANSILKDDSMPSLVTKDNITQWIRDNCERFDVIIDKKYGKNALNFIEGMLHYKYNPKYEG